MQLYYMKTADKEPEKEIDFNLDQELARDAIEIWGKDTQLFIVAEELAELIQAISKWKRYKTDEVRQWVTEELADVYIMTMQLLWMLNIEDESIINAIHEKQDIIRERLENVEKDLEEN